MLHVLHRTYYSIPNHDSKSCEQPLAITKRHLDILSIFSHLKVSGISFNSKFVLEKKQKERYFVLYLSIFYPYEIPDENR